jgi:hypothetical protein
VLALGLLNPSAAIGVQREPRPGIGRGIRRPVCDIAGGRCRTGPARRPSLTTVGPQMCGRARPSHPIAVMARAGLEDVQRLACPGPRAPRRFGERAARGCARLFGHGPRQSDQRWTLLRDRCPGRRRVHVRQRDA